MQFNPALKFSPNAGAELLAYGLQKPGILSLGQGRGDEATPDFIANAAYNAMKNGETFYGPTLGHPKLRAELATYYKNIFNINIPQNRIFVTPSGSAAMHQALSVILGPGDDLVALTPIWKNLIGAVELAGANTIQVPLNDDPNHGWSLDLEKLFAACTPRTRAILITSPSNPTGWCMGHEDIKRVVEFSRQNNIWIISDEVYARCMYGKKHAPSFLEHTHENDLLLTINSFSKSWAMTGWRLGWIVGPTQAADLIQNIAMYENLCPPAFTQFGAIAALKHGEPFLKKQMKLWETNRDLLIKRLAPYENIQIHRPEAAFYGFFKVAGQDDDIAFCRHLIDKAGLSLSPGCSFGKGGKGYVRICYAISTKNFIEALDRLESVL